MFIVHSKSKVTQVRKHLLYMIRNPVIQREPYQKQYSITDIHGNSIKPDQIWDYTEFWFCIPKEEKSHAKRLRGEGQSGIKVGWEQGSYTDSGAAVAERLPQNGWPSSGRDLLSTPTHIFLLSRESGPQCSAPKEENF